MRIWSHAKEYEVRLEESLDFLSGLAGIPNAQFVLDKKVYELYRDHFADMPQERLVLIEAEENRKTFETALDICERMTDIPAKRNAHLVSIGGGIIQDITGFAASILYRGIPWTFVPTTLLACCDSCIGGKTSLNYRKYKNLLGTFYAPDTIYICPVFFHTLSQRDFESGLGEVVKFNIMRGREGLESIEESLEGLLDRREDMIKQAVENSLRFKKDFIEEDEYDRGERIKLNFAHTFGHAVETVTEYAIPHGTAVAIGMIMADRISQRRGILDPRTAERSERILRRVIHPSVCLEDYPFDRFLEAIRKDKKQVSDQLTAVLMTDTARDLRIVHDISVEEIRDAFRYYCGHSDDTDGFIETKG